MQGIAERLRVRIPIEHYIIPQSLSFYYFFITFLLLFLTVKADTEPLWCIKSSFYVLLNIMQKSMEDLAARIRRDLNEYQAQVQARLEKLFAEGLVSQTQLKEIVIDAKITGQSVVDALSSQGNYSEEVTEIYIYSLFDRYKNAVEKKIYDINQRKVSSVNEENLKFINNKKFSKISGNFLVGLFKWEKSPILKVLRSLLKWEKSPILKILKRIISIFNNKLTQ